MKPTKSNLLIFIIANSDYRDGVVTCHSREGEAYIKSLVQNKAKTKLVQGRFFKTRKEKWEYLLQKNPSLELIKEML